MRIVLAAVRSVDDLFYGVVDASHTSFQQITSKILHSKRLLGRLYVLWTAIHD